MHGAVVTLFSPPGASGSRGPCKSFVMLPSTALRASQEFDFFLRLAILHYSGSAYFDVGIRKSLRRLLSYTNSHLFAPYPILTKFEVHIFISLSSFFFSFCSVLLFGALSAQNLELGCADARGHLREAVRESACHCGQTQYKSTLYKRVICLYIHPLSERGL